MERSQPASYCREHEKHLRDSLGWLERVTTWFSWMILAEGWAQRQGRGIWGAEETFGSVRKQEMQRLKEEGVSLGLPLLPSAFYSSHEEA